MKKTSNKKISNLHWLINNTKYSIGVLCIIPFVCFISSLCNIGISLIFKGYMDIASGENLLSFKQMTVFSCSVIIVFALTQIASSVLEGLSYSKSEKGLRYSLIKKIIEKNLQEFQKMHTGEVQNRLTTDIATISDFYIQLFGQVSLVIFTSLFAIVLLFILNWKITLIFLVVIPLLTLLISLFSPRLQQAAKVDSENEDLNRSYMQELLMFLPLHQIYSMKKNVCERMSVIYKKKTTGKIKLSVLEGSFGFLNSLMSFGIFIITSAVGAYFVKTGENSVGDLVAMIQLSNYIMLPLTEMPKMIATYNKTINSVKRIREIENMQNRHSVVLESADALDINCIKIDNLSFEYEQGKNILNDVNALFRKGCITGIVGSSGSGKSTLIKLILGLYTPDKNNGIEIQGNDNTQNYYNFAGVASYVPSDNFVFSGTIKDNICMNLSFDREKFEDVCKKVNIFDLITSFELKENVNINESGNNLSMGQKQRIAIARALYAETPVLIFDEPTANLDSASVEIFTEMIQNISEDDKISIIVTHDRAVAAICDCVYELKEGNLINVGKE